MPPVVSSSAHEPEPQREDSAGSCGNNRRVAPLCREFGVDMLLSGHDHLCQRYPGDLIEVVSGGGGGGGKSLYEINHRPEGLVTATTVDGDVLDELVIDKRDLLERGAARGRAERIARLRALVE